MSKKDDKEKQIIVPETVISLEEFNNRKKVYSEYYEKCRETKAFKKFQQARGLMKRISQSRWSPGDPPTEDIKALRKISQWAKNRMASEEREVPPPPYEDPEIQQRKGELGIKDYWQKNIKDAQKNGQQVIYQNEESRSELTQIPDF